MKLKDIIRNKYLDLPKENQDDENTRLYFYVDTDQLPVLLDALNFISDQINKTNLNSVSLNFVINYLLETELENTLEINVTLFLLNILSFLLHISKINKDSYFNPSLIFQRFKNRLNKNINKIIFSYYDTDSLKIEVIRKRSALSRKIRKIDPEIADQKCLLFKHTLIKGEVFLRFSFKTLFYKFLISSKNI